MNYKIKRLIKSIINIFITKKMLIFIIIGLLFILLDNHVFGFDTLPTDTPTTSVTVTGNFPYSNAYENSVTITYPTAWAQYVDLDNILVASPGRTYLYCPTSSNVFYVNSQAFNWTDCDVIFYHTYYRQWRLHHAGQNDYDQRCSCSYFYNLLYFYDIY